MLKQLSRLERTRSIVIIGFAVMMAVSLVIFYAPGRNSGATPPATSTDVLARVGGDNVTVADLTRYKEGMQRRFGGQFDISQLGGDRRLLDNLIQARVVTQEAVRLGLAASDAEVAEAIRKQFKDPGGNFVGLERYREIVRANYGDVEAFERELRDSIAAQKLDAFITAGVRVSDEEVQDDYKRKNTSFNLSYIPVTVDRVAKKVTPSDVDLRAYFEQHKAEYRINVPQKKIRYLYFEQAKVGAKLTISEQVLRQEYDKLPPENKQAGVHVQQIVLKVARGDLDAQVKAKADALVTKARGDSGNVTEAAFADLARGNSEDPTTAKNGGQVPYIIKRNPNKPDDPLQKTLDMQVGAVSEPVKFGNAYFIFRRGEAVPKTYEEAKAEILVSQRNREAYGVAAKLAARAAERLKEKKDDIQKIAQEFAAEANMTPAEMVKETGYIKPEDNVPDIGVSQQFEQAIAGLNNIGDVGDRTPVKGGFAVPILVDKKEPRDAEFDEVKDKVADAVKKEKAKAQLEQVARDLSQGVTTAADLKAAAEKQGMTALTADSYKLGSPLAETGANPTSSSAATDDVIFGLKEGEVTKTPVKIGDNWVVIGVTKRTDADLAEFAKQRDSLVDTALRTRKSQIFEDYISAVQDRMTREGKIKVNEDVLARLQEDAPAAAPPRPRLPPGFPPPTQ